MPSLKLGAIPEDKPVRMTITLPAALARDLEAYAQAWSKETSRTLGARHLVPHMLDAFIRSDKGFAAAKRTVELRRQTAPSEATVGHSNDEPDPLSNAS